MATKRKKRFSRKIINSTEFAKMSDGDLRKMNKERHDQLTQELSEIDKVRSSLIFSLKVNKALGLEENTTTWGKILDFLDTEQDDLIRILIKL
jgi:hypothetical protein